MGSGTKSKPLRSAIVSDGDVGILSVRPGEDIRLSVLDAPSRPSADEMPSTEAEGAAGDDRGAALGAVSDSGKVCATLRGEGVSALAGP